MSILRGGSILVLASVLCLSCASIEEIGEDPPQNSLADGARTHPAHADVRTVQFYRTGDEKALPIVPLNRGGDLTLAFDLLGSDARPLSVYFYHADRQWRRDLVPAEYLSGFHRDDILDYGLSRATHVAYVHYRYAFPNDNIDFRLSGNYVVRVTEQGMEEEVILERPFYVTEQSAALDLALNDVRLTGEAFPATQPSVRFTPPSASGTAFDYTVCFLRNGRLAGERCTDRPALDYQPALRYFLEPEDSFGAQASDYWLDLSDLRPGGRIERVDLLETPYTVLLEPDYFRFPGTALAPLQNGQIVVEGAVRNVVDPGTASEYAWVRFALVPDDEQPVRGSVGVVGPFNDWTVTTESRMQWMPEEGRYEAEILLKQGFYEYRYVFTNPDVARASRGASPRFDNAITTFVYYNDLRVGTDRLIAAVNSITR